VLENQCQLTIGRRPEPSERARVERHQRAEGIPALGAQMVLHSTLLQHERTPDHHFGASEPQPRLVVDPYEGERGVIQDELPTTVRELSDPAAFYHHDMFARGLRGRTSTETGRAFPDAYARGREAGLSGGPPRGGAPPRRATAAEPAGR